MGAKHRAGTIVQTPLAERFSFGGAPEIAILLVFLAKSKRKTLAGLGRGLIHIV
jgi:hypothetical protein